MNFDPYYRINSKAIIDWMASQHPLQKGVTFRALRDQFMAHNPRMCAAVPRLRCELAKLRRRGFVDYGTVDHPKVWFLKLPPADVFQSLMAVCCTKVMGIKKIKALTPWELLEASDFLIRYHYRASDNIIRVPPKPKWLETYR